MRLPIYILIGDIENIIGNIYIIDTFYRLGINVAICIIVIYFIYFG